MGQQKFTVNSSPDIYKYKYKYKSSLSSCMIAGKQTGRGNEVIVCLFSFLNYSSLIGIKFSRVDSAELSVL